MQEQYCGWCSTTTMGSYGHDGDIWVCGICRSGNQIPSVETIRPDQVQ